MKVLRHVRYTGRKSKTGRICFDENGRMVVFVDYCPDCRGKVVMKKEDAQRFARLHHAETKKTSTRLLEWIVSRRRVDDTPLRRSNDKEAIKRELMQEMIQRLQSQH